MLKTFQKGGIHPPENKLSAGKPILPFPVTGTVAIMLSQHMGSPAKVLIEKGARVKTGQLIARGEGFLSGNIHASVTGTVSKIDEIQDVSGYKRQAVFIDVSPDEWFENINTDSALDREIKLGSAEIIARITEAGIVGLGGATFPSHVKLTVPRGKKAECLVINGVECEPYLTADHALMLEKAEEIMIGIQILKKALQVNMAHIGIENNKPDALATMERLALSYDGIKVHSLRVKYPQGGEKQLIKAVTGREVPSGGLPVDIGAVAFNVGTVYAVYEAVQKNKPLIERIVTVTGKNVRNPANYKVRIGTPVSALIEAAGGAPEDTGKVIMGGPMMGKALGSAEVPVVKGTSGVLLIPDSESVRTKQQPCIRCAKCVSVCPMGLEPYLLMPLSQQNNFERLESEHIMDCIECGSCSYICPAGRPLLDYVRLGKSNVGKILRTRKKTMSKLLTVSPSPHISSSLSVNALMYGVALSLVPAFLVTLYVFGAGALIVTAVSVVTCVLAEAAIQRYIMKTPVRISDGSAMVTGILLAFNLPSNIPWWMVVIGALFAIGIGKMTYGGLGNNPFNPALVGRVFLLISFPVQMTSWPLPIVSRFDYTDAATGATPLGFLKEAIRNGEKVPDVMNQIPDHMQMFMGQMGGSLGEISAVALILGFGWLLYKKIITWHIPVVMVGTIYIFTAILWMIDPSTNASPLFHILTGGVMLGAIYMATDLVTSPMTRTGIIIYAAGIGLLTVIIRKFGAYPEGVSFAILIMNAFVPLINKYVKPKRFGEEVKHG